MNDVNLNNEVLFRVAFMLVLGLMALHAAAELLAATDRGSILMAAGTLFSLAAIAVPASLISRYFHDSSALKRSSAIGFAMAQVLALFAGVTTYVTGYVLSFASAA